MAGHGGDVPHIEPIANTAVLPDVGRRGFHDFEYELGFKYDRLYTAATSRSIMFSTTERGREYHEKLVAFMDEHVYPAEPVFAEQMISSAGPRFHAPTPDAHEAEARKRGLWN